MVSKVNNNGRAENIISKLFRFFLGDGILKICALIFMIMGGCLYVKEYMTAKDYVKTVGTFVDYTTCNDGMCGSKYSYVVNGETYYVSSDLQSNYFPEKDDVYYNPENPSEGMMYSNWHVLFIAGVVIFAGIEFFKRKIKSYIAKNDKKGPINV